MNAIIKMIKNVFGKPKKSDVETEIDITIKELSLTLDSFQNYFVDKATLDTKEWKTIDVPLVKAIQQTELSIKIDSRTPFMFSSVPLLKNIIENGLFIAEEIKRIGGSTIVTAGASARTANILTGLTHYVYLATWFTHYQECLERFSIWVEFDDESIYTNEGIESRMKSLIARIDHVSSLIGVYAEKPEVFKAKVNALSNEAIETVPEAQGLSGSFNLVPVISQGFMGSPVFAVRGWFGARQTKKILLLAEKKKLLESRRLYLIKLREEGKGDSLIERDIKIFEERIEEMQAEIEAYERKIA